MPLHNAGTVSEFLKSLCFRKLFLLPLLNLQVVRPFEIVLGEMMDEVGYDKERIVIRQ